MGRQRCCRCSRCENVQCYTDDAENGQQKVNETTFTLTNIPDVVVLWTYTAPSVAFGVPAYFYKWTSKLPNAYAPTAEPISAFNGTHIFERDQFCRFPKVGDQFFEPLKKRCVFDRERYVASPSNSTNLFLSATDLDVQADVSLWFLHDETRNSLGGHVFENPPAWYMHYIAVSLDRATNPICPPPDAQATCGTSDLSWITEPFVDHPYPYPQTLDWSLHRNTYAVGSTAQSFA